ncbi:SH3 domain-containing protein [Candidatus Thiosymbion oneisti]|uniref:SH3 domain-containing protein n=1 Tax=Candidatus Thiosymbion oneisti TaxID=589554 RepID=UPI000AC17664|nr:SH3 domain-containing protein [Candidatus Thiosymbion oneisti]
MANSPGFNHRTQIIVAVIGLAGVLGTAGIANLPQLLKVFGTATPQQREAEGVRQLHPSVDPGDERGVSPGSRSPSGSTDRPLVESLADAPLQSERQSLFNLRATIDDPDGYTNVRSQGSVSGAIIDRIAEGEEFHTHVQKGSWWQIKTPRGKVGYMHVSRIKLR